MDFAAGALLNSTEYWLGLSAKHLTQPNSSLTGDRVPLPLTISLHGGYRFIIEQKSKDENVMSLLHLITVTNKNTIN
jgi:hypothetical protein